MHSDPTSVMALAQGFAPASRDLWRAVAEKSLKGATVESLARTIEGVTIDPLYAGDPVGVAPAPLSRPPHDP